MLRSGTFNPVTESCYGIQRVKRIIQTREFQRRLLTDSLGVSPILVWNDRWPRPPSMEGVPRPIISTALFGRCASREAADFGDYAKQVLAAMKKRFGGHEEKPGSR